MPGEISFYAIAGLTVLFAVAAMTLRQLVHCAFCAAAAFAGLGVIYLQLDAEFVGFAQLLVYVGAIAILIVFAVLLTRGDEVGTGSTQSSPSWMLGLLIALFVTGGIVVSLLASSSFQRTAQDVAAAPVKNIGTMLMTRYVLPLEMVGVLLTGALLGAVVLAKRDLPEVKKMIPRPAPRTVEPGKELVLR